MTAHLRHFSIISLLILGACAPRLAQHDIIAALGPAIPGGLAAGASAGTPHDASTMIRDTDHVRVRAIGSRLLAASAEFCAAADGLVDRSKVSIAESQSPKDGEEIVVLSSVPACDIPLIISDDGEVNAFANGHRVRVTRGLVRFARKDAELAFAIAHEVSHNLLHSRGSALAGSRKQMEYEADYLGLYLVARAGYSIAPAAGLLRRLSSAYPGRDRLHPNYPTFSARSGELPEIAREIERKKQAKEPLVPELARRIYTARSTD